MALLIAFSFLAGIVTILSPCILPVLPIILSTSTSGGKRRPFAIVVGFVLSFVFFTLALTTIVKATGLDGEVLRNVAIGVLIFFGVSLLIPKFQLWMEILFSKLAGKFSKAGKEEQGGFGGGVVIGLSLGLLWTPCVGPIMAGVLALAATSSVTLQAVFITLAYALGTALPMFGIIYGGRRLLEKVPFLLRNTGRIQKVFGVIIILVAVGMFYGVDRKFQAYVLEKFPFYGSGLTAIEDLDIVNDQLKELGMREEEVVAGECRVAPGFEEGGEWLNSAPLVLEELRGKVVLVDFWTYTCVNCIRTFPHVTAWDEKYRDDGLVIVGVHTPEFEFEKSKENVAGALKDYGIEYPVVQDNDYKIWRSYNNRYWPAHYFIDKDGCIRHTHFGEGKYDESERVIQELLSELGDEVSSEVLDIEE